MKYEIPLLPISFDLETKSILKKLAHAHRALAELKGVTGIIPNQSILIDTLLLQEAKESSEIENIITTHDELYKYSAILKDSASKSVKEVHNYAAALRRGYDKVKESSLLTNNLILEIQAVIEENSAGFRKLPGTELINEQTGQVVYSPPQDGQVIKELMANLEKFINDESLSSLDSLTKMAIIHHQFESIHPFYDGNGRTGRIINVLYLVKNGLLDTPVLYLSRSINKKKSEYYRLLQSVRKNKNSWEEWVLFILDAVIETSFHTISLIQKMRDLMLHHKNHIREKLPKIYSQDLLNNLFRHPYTKVDFVTSELRIHRNTARKYLDELLGIGIVSKYKIGKDSFYINTELFELLKNSGPFDRNG
ncbi:MAG: Fic family protein [Candidatus Algichlamydia australiensis]|nr:Fic family protein [Chlamydiales bacterium]